MNQLSYKHISLQERETIENLLSSPDVLLKTIAASLDRSSKSIRHEIMKHRSLRIRSNQKNKCGKQNDCTLSRLCGDCIAGRCSTCSHDNCNQICPYFSKEPVCSRIQRFPYVCNACPNRLDCKLPKFFYSARIAENEHLHAVSDWKCGPRKSEVDMARITKAFQEGIKHGLSVDVIIEKYQLNISVSTAYRYINDLHIPNVKNIDLKRKVRYAPRKTSATRITPRNYDHLKGRRFSDFQQMMEDHPNCNVWQMDTIIGKQGKEEKCVLSLLYQKTNLQFYFLLESHNALQVTKLFDAIKQVLGLSLFKDTFSILLTDNGHEFSEPQLIETDFETGEQLCHVFYCEPRRSDQKGKCEKNHEHFREMIPKGYSMNALSKKEMNYVSNMVNNYPRKSLRYHSPLEVSKLFLDEKVFSINRLHTISYTQVKLNTIVR